MRYLISQETHPLLEMFTWKGRVSRTSYALIAFCLLAFKYNLDRLLTWQFLPQAGPYPFLLGLEPARYPLEQHWQFYLSLLALTIPFAWIGICLTLRRLRDAGLSVWLSLLLVLPLINLLFAALLCFIPSREMPDGGEGCANLARKYLPDSRLGSATVSILVTAPVAVLLIWAGTHVWARYGWGLFIGTPFFLGFSSVLLHGLHRPRRLAECLGVSCMAIFITGGILLAVALEGVICLLMALPIALVASLLGGLLGYFLQRSWWLQQTNPRLAFTLPLLVMAAMIIENQQNTEPPLTRIVTSVEINAPPERVWPLVIAFSEIPAPREWIFKSGIAYPTHARIEGTGVGAIRYCEFSTGSFVEPITVWYEPNVLAFSVRRQPRAMDEMSPWHHLEPAHVKDYLVSERGELRLTPLDGNRTRLQGTTWYRHHIWPAAYWQVYSDYLIHAIHRRVLEHIKAEAE